MIPKIIHYSWFSGEEMPESFIQMMDTWKKHLPDYEFKLWDRKALDEANIMFANEAISVRKWAFAADAIRVYAVYHYGGIWLDGDAAIYQSFDPFLKFRMFIGKEHSDEFQINGRGTYVHRLTSHCFGAEKGHPFFKDCVDYYRGRHFIQSENEELPQGLRYDMRLLPSIHALLAVKYGYKGALLDVDKEEVLEEDIHVFPPYYFDTPKYHSMDSVYCIHHCFHSWTPVPEKHLRLSDGTVCQKKNLYYYLYTWVNKLMAKRGLQIRVQSV